MTRSVFLLPALYSLLVAGCGERPPPAPIAEEPAHAGADPAGPEHGEGAATLRVIMVALGEDMGELNAGLWAGDFERVAAAAGRVADHPRVEPAEMQRVQGALGPEFPDFVAFDRQVHDASVALRQAATERDTTAVLGALAEVQRGCVGCHTRFRERLLAPAP